MMLSSPLPLFLREAGPVTAGPLDRVVPRIGRLDGEHVLGRRRISRRTVGGTAGQSHSRQPESQKRYRTQTHNPSLKDDVFTRLPKTLQTVSPCLQPATCYPTRYRVTTEAGSRPRAGLWTRGTRSLGGERRKEGFDAGEDE